MNIPRTYKRLIFLAVLFLTPLPLSAEQAGLLKGPPVGERWFSITTGDERTGFTRTAIAATPDGFEVRSDSSAKMVVRGFPRDASSKEKYLVNRDLSLRSFVVDQINSGNRMVLKGEATGKGLRLTIASEGKTRDKMLKAKGKVYPSPVLNIYPLMQAVQEGKKHRLQMFDPEDVKVKDVVIKLIGVETLPGGREAIHMSSDLFTLVDNDIWVDRAGNTIMESVADGLVVTRAEDEPDARRFLAEAAIAKKGMVLDYSLVRPDKQIERPAELKRLAIELSGIPDFLPLITGAGQSAKRLAGGRVLFTVEQPLLPLKKVQPGDSVNKDENRIVDLAPPSLEQARKAKEIAGEEKDPVVIAAKLVRWVAENIKESTDDLTPDKTLAMGKGDCLSRVRLYTALAGGAGIPSRVVAGLVYQHGKGFLFHAWAESLAGGWLPVDPNLTQIPADATHIKLAEAESAAGLALLSSVIGQLEAKVVEELYKDQ